MGERCGSDHFFYLYFAGETQSREGPELSGNVSHFQPLAIRAHWYKTSLGHISNSDSCFPEVMLVFSTTHLILTTLAIFTSCSLVEVTAKLMAPDQEQAMTWAWQFPVTIGKRGKKKHRFKQNWLHLVSVTHFQLADWFDSGKENCFASHPMSEST